MKHILIDSHILLWLLFEPTKVSDRVRTLLENADGVSISRCSFFELTIKHSIGKLAYPPEMLRQGAKELGLSILEIKDEHLSGYDQIKLSHSDPFDKLLIAQCRYEKMKFTTADELILGAYPRLTVDARYK